MARELAASGRQVVILSGDAGMPNTPDLLCANSNGIPYPRWIRRRFNFNDWTRFPVRNKNAYEVCAPAPAAAP